MKLENIPPMNRASSVDSLFESLSSFTTRHGRSNKNPDGGSVEGSTPGLRSVPSEMFKESQPATCTDFVKDSCHRMASRKSLEKTFPILKWGREYSVKKAVSDFIAGLTVGLTILPQGLAYATVAGLPPIYGLYSGFVGCFVYILFGGTKAITIGPNAIQCILTWKYTQGKPPEYAVFLCATSGVIFMLMYIFRLGFIANFISEPVISGFTSAVSLTIISTQMKGLLGIKFHEEGFLPTMQGVWNHRDEIQWDRDPLMSLMCCSALFFFIGLRLIGNCLGRRYPKLNSTLWFVSTSKNAIVIIGATVAMALNYRSQDDSRFSLAGVITPGMPTVKPPPFEIISNETFTNATGNYTVPVVHTFWDILSEESEGVIILPLLGLMGHMTIAKAFAGSTRVEASQEILSIGVSNLIACFFSSMPIVGSFSRTTVNAMSGAESPAGGLVTGLIVVLALQFLTPYFYFIPKASLASVVCCSVIFMIDLKILKPMWKSKKTDLIPWLLTVLVTLFVGLEHGIAIGLATSAMFLLYYAARPRVKIHRGYTAKNTEFIVTQLDRSLTFPSVDYITDVIGKAATRYARRGVPVVVDCQHIQFADFTAVTAMSHMVHNFSQFGYKILFWRMKPSILRLVSGLMEDNRTDFTHCMSEADLEAVIDDYVAEHEKLQTRIEFHNIDGQAL